MSLVLFTVDGHITSKLMSLEEEDAFFANIHQRATTNHEFVWCQCFDPLHERIQALFTVTTNSNKHCTYSSKNYEYYLGPKITASLKEGNVTRRTYENGVVEELYIIEESGSGRHGVQRLTDGRVRIGHFTDASSFAGTEINQGIQTLHSPRPRPEHCLDIQGRNIIIAPTHNERFQRRWCLAEKVDAEHYQIREELSLIDALFSQQKLPLHLRYDLVNDPSLEEVIRQLFNPNNRAFLGALSVNELLFALSRATTLLPPGSIDLHTPLPDKKVLMQHFLAEVSPEDTEGMLRADPTLVYHSGSEPFSLFVQALLIGKKEIALKLLEGMKKQGMPEAPTDLWCQIILSGAANFSDEEFLALPPECKPALYRIGNILDATLFVERLNALGMQHPPLPDPGSYFGPGMDSVTLSRCAHALFMKLRQRGDLLTLAEYQARYPCTREGRVRKGRDEGNGFTDKGDCISRLFGALYFNKRAKEVGSTFTRAVRKILVIQDRVDPLSIVGRHTFFTLQGGSPGLRVKAEYIPPCDDYRPTAAESMDLVRAVESAGYIDLHPNANVRITSKGAFIIDNELRNLASLDKAAYKKLLRFPLDAAALEYVQTKLDNWDCIAEERAALPQQAERNALVHSVGLDIHNKPLFIDFPAILATPLKPLLL